MNVPGSIFVKWHRLQQDVVVIIIHLLREVNNFVDVPLDFEGVWVHLFANLAFKTFPVEGTHILILSIWWFFLFLCEYPVLQALEVDEADRSLALAGNNQRVC